MTASLDSYTVMQTSHSWAGLPTKDETVKMTRNTWNMPIPGLIYVFCPRCRNIMAYSMIWQKKNKFTVAGNHQYRKTENIKFRTVVFEVSSFEGHPVVGFPANETFREKKRKFSVAFRKLFREISHFYAKFREKKFRKTFIQRKFREMVAKNAKFSRHDFSLSLETLLCR